MKRNLIVIDFETYYDKTYSLSKMTTEEYIRSPEFEVIGFSVSVNGSTPVWHTGTKGALKQALEQYDFEGSAVVAHNAVFDASILYWVFGIKCGIIVDTMSMARAMNGVDVGASLGYLAKLYGLGQKGTEVLDAHGLRRKDMSSAFLAKYSRYCCNDVTLTYDLFRHLRVKLRFPISEMKIIDVTLRMYVEPVLELDVPLLEDHLVAVAKRKQELLDSGQLDRETIMSNDKFAAYLRTLGVEPPTKISKRTGKEAYAFAKTDKAFTALSDHPDESVQTAVAARLGVKTTLEESRTQRFLGIASRGTLPGPVKYYAAHTGRAGGCLVADTVVTVYHETTGTVEKRIVDVLADDLVWDGEEFVSHDGVQFSGMQEVVTHDGVTGTKEHEVFTADGTFGLLEAMQRGLPIEAPERAPEYGADTCVGHIRDDKSEGVGTV